MRDAVHRGKTNQLCWSADKMEVMNCCKVLHINMSNQQNSTPLFSLCSHKRQLLTLSHLSLTPSDQLKYRSNGFASFKACACLTKCRFLIHFQSTDSWSKKKVTKQFKFTTFHNHQIISNPCLKCCGPTMIASHKAEALCCRDRSAGQDFKAPRAGNFL